MPQAICYMDAEYFGNFLMRSLILGTISALTFAFSAAAEPLTGSDMSFALGGKMLDGDDGKMYRFYSNGLLEVTDGDDGAVALSFGKWAAGPKYLCLQFPGSEERQFYTLDARGVEDGTIGTEGFEGPLSVIMEPIEGGLAVSGRLDNPLTIRMQRMLDEGADMAPLPDIVNELKPVLLAADTFSIIEQNGLPTDGAEGAE